MSLSWFFGGAMGIVCGVQMVVVGLPPGAFSLNGRFGVSALYCGSFLFFDFLFFLPFSLFLFFGVLVAFFIGRLFLWGSWLL